MMMVMMILMIQLLNMVTIWGNNTKRLRWQTINITICTIVMVESTSSYRFLSRVIWVPDRHLLERLEARGQITYTLDPLWMCHEVWALNSLDLCSYIHETLRIYDVYFPVWILWVLLWCNINVQQYLTESQWWCLIYDIPPLCHIHYMLFMIYATNHPQWQIWTFCYPMRNDLFLELILLNLVK